MILEIPCDLLPNVVDYKRLQNAIARISEVEFCGRQESATRTLSIGLLSTRSPFCFCFGPAPSTYPDSVTFEVFDPFRSRTLPQVS